MKVAIVGSRNLTMADFAPYLPEGTTEIISGGAKGIDRCAQEYARQQQISFKEFLPDYRRYGKGAPLKRNIAMAEYAQEVVALWDGKSKGTGFIVDYCRKKQIPVHVYVITQKK